MMKTLLLIYVKTSIIFFVTGVVTTKGDLLSIAFTPEEIYDVTDCNMFFCVLLFVLWIFVNPFYALYRLLHWAMHVGRKY